jgi:uncharacterized membrane protein YeaQ/YmgE (transglycosylase-associated protein family)
MEQVYRRAVPRPVGRRAPSVSRQSIWLRYHESEPHGRPGFRRFHFTTKRNFFMSIVWTILIGFVVGLVARAVKPGDDSAGFIITTIIGIAGSLIATYIGQAMGWYIAGQGAGFIASVLGAIVLLILYGLIKRKS